MKWSDIVIILVELIICALLAFLIFKPPLNVSIGIILL